MLNRRILSLCFMITAASAIPACTAKERDFGGDGGGSSSTSSGCPEAEQCFDGVDNDCDGDTDCADKECEGGSVCMPEPPGFKVGMVIPLEDACPDGFQEEGPSLNRGLQGTGCTGCSCAANPTDCKADLWYYKTLPECEGDANLTGGKYAGTFGLTCNPTPIDSGTTYGGRSGPYQVIESCVPSGVSELEKPSWKETRKFCRAMTVGGGCATGQVCAPKQDPAIQCAVAPGGVACDGYPTAQQDWFTDFNDMRTSCSACSCTVSGGDCNNVSLWFGNDYSCFEDEKVPSGQKVCGQHYSPPVYMVGTPTQSTCNADAKVDGSLYPSGQSTICCLQ